jgi:hypothetical protein
MGTFRMSRPCCGANRGPGGSFSRHKAGGGGETALSLSSSAEVRMSAAVLALMGRTGKRSSGHVL